MAPHKAEEELFDEEPPTIDPYEVLGISKTATAQEIKTAYRKAALKHHPDKVPSEKKDAAHIKIQEIVFAYGVLSDTARRARYDTTGSTAETVDFDGFSWSEYYSAQFADVVTGDSINRFSATYKGSEEEKNDVFAAYRKGKGKWKWIYESVMLSNPLEDEDRFREIIDEGIKNGELEYFEAYSEEPKQTKNRRMNAAREEAEEAAVEKAKMAKSKKSGGGEKGKAMAKANGLDNLAVAMAESRQKRQQVQASFLERLEAEAHAAEAEKKSKGKKGKGKKRAQEEDGMPSEEAFLATRARMLDDEGQKAKKLKR